MPAAVLLVAAVAAGGSRTCGERPRPPPARSSRGSGPAGAGVSAARAVAVAAHAEAGRETPLCGRLFFTVSHWKRKDPPYPFLLLLEDVTFCMLDEIESESVVSQSLLARSAKNTQGERKMPGCSAGLFLPLPFISPSVLPRDQPFPTAVAQRTVATSPVTGGRETEYPVALASRLPAEKKEGGGPRRRNGRSPPPPPVSAKWSAAALPPLRFQPNLTGKG